MPNSRAQTMTACVISKPPGFSLKLTDCLVKRQNGIRIIILLYRIISVLSSVKLVRFVRARESGVNIKKNVFLFINIIFLLL